MDLKVGDLVAFKKYEDMTEEERFGIKKDFFPKAGKVGAVDDNGYFRIEGNSYCFKFGSVYSILTDNDKGFIVKEDYYGMYVNGSGVLITDKRHAKVYKSRDEANEEAADMHLNAWEVIPYGD